MICYDMLSRDKVCNRTQCVYNLVNEPNEQILKCHVFVNASAVWDQWHNLRMHIMKLFFPPNILQLTLLASICKYSGDIAQWCAVYQVVPGTRRDGSFQEETWLMGIHGELKRSELTWHEMHEMNELTWINWNDDLTWRNWHAWTETNELTWMNWNEWLDINEMHDLKWVNWNEWLDMTDLTWKNWHERNATNKWQWMHWNEEARTRGNRDPPAATMDGHFTCKNTSFLRPRMFSTVNSRFPDRSHFPTTWWWCGWHDDVVPTMTTAGCENRSQFGNFLTKLPLVQIVSNSQTSNT